MCRRLRRVDKHEEKKPYYLLLHGRHVVCELRHQSFARLALEHLDVNRRGMSRLVFCIRNREDDN